MHCYYYSAPVYRSSEFTNLIPENTYLFPPLPIVPTLQCLATATPLLVSRFDFLFRFHIRGEIIEYSSFSDLFHSAHCPPGSFRLLQIAGLPSFSWPSNIPYVLCLVAQSCPTLCNPMDCSPPGSSVHVISQAKMLELVAISFPRTFLIYVYYSFFCHSSINKHLDVSMSWLLCFSCPCILKNSPHIF